VLFDVLDVAGEAEEFERLKAAPIHLLGDREHGAGLHAERPQAQLTVTQRRIDEMNFFHADFLRRVERPALVLTIRPPPS
jgi:hypothetical protein